MLGHMSLDFHFCKCTKPKLLRVQQRRGERWSFTVCARGLNTLQSSSSQRDGLTCLFVMCRQKRGRRHVPQLLCLHLEECSTLHCLLLSVQHFCVLP